MHVTHDLLIKLRKDYTRPHDNFTPGERQALRQLKAREDIVIKAADKGAAVVIMNLCDYITETYRQLNDTRYYQSLPRSTTMVNHDIITKLLDKMFQDCEIDKKCHKFLTNFEPRTARFYLLPKIHKGKFPPPGRPII